MRTQIKQAALALYVYREEDDAAIIEHLTLHGIDADLAERLVTFVPIAFGRHLLAGKEIQFCDKYARFQDDGTITDSGRLAEEPVYSATCEAAVFHSTNRDLFLAVSLRSAEVQAVNEALNGGAKARNLVIAPVTIFDAPPTDLGLRQSHLYIQKSLEARTPKKPWWKLW